MVLESRRRFLVKQQVAFGRMTDAYDILDPETGAVIGHAAEEPSGWALVARLFLEKAYLPTRVNVYDREAAGPVLTLSKASGFFGQQVEVEVDSGGERLGMFQSKLCTVGGGFYVYDAAGGRVAEVKGDWGGWNFQYLTEGGDEIGVVTKQWAGLGRELFTCADTYMVDVTAPDAGPNAAALLLAAGLSIDLVYKEGRRK